MFWAAALVIILYGLYKYVYKPTLYWKERGVVHKTQMPFLFDVVKFLLRRISFFDSVIELYNQFPNERYHGFYQFGQPALLIRDLDLIKQIGVKNFEHFVDHRDVGNANLDELFSKNIFNLNGSEWKQMRATLSPAFTASKMKAMFTLISECADQMTQYFEEQKKDMIELELKDLFTRYTNDVIATCAFGVTCDSLKDRDNTFYTMGTDATDFSGFRGLKMLIGNFTPKILKIFNIRVFPEYISNFFINIIKESIEYRSKNGVIRPDIIHLLLEARKGKLQHEEVKDSNDKGFAIIEESEIGKEESKAPKELTDVDIAAQAFIFFFAGFDTSSTLLSFLATEVAINTDVQDKLYEEVRSVMTKCNGKPTYESIMGMKYMDMVVSECLRMWTPGVMIERMCTKQFTIEAKNPTENDYVVDVGDIVAISILGLHRDPNYFPNPNKFDPERFSEENKSKIVPYSYLPFGVGPRACIASRFALMEIKIMLAYILNTFEMHVVEKTSVPIKLSASTLKLQPENGFWIGFKARNMETSSI